MAAGGRAPDPPGPRALDGGALERQGPGGDGSFTEGPAPVPPGLPGQGSGWQGHVDVVRAVTRVPSLVRPPTDERRAGRLVRDGRRAQSDCGKSHSRVTQGDS